MEQDPGLYHCSGMWSIMSSQNFKGCGKFGGFCFCFVLFYSPWHCTLSTFVLWRTWNKKTDVFVVKGEQVCDKYVWEMIEEQSHFFRVMAWWGGPWSRGLSITGVRVEDDKAEEGCRLHLKLGETIQLAVLWGLRKFHIRVRSPHFSCCVCP